MIVKGLQLAHVLRHCCKHRRFCLRFPSEVLGPHALWHIAIAVIIYGGPGWDDLIANHAQEWDERCSPDRDLLLRR